jgi:transposase
VEENSGLGKAIRYFNNHFDGLTCFSRVEGAMLDNNLMEAMLKLIVRNRKNAGFFKTVSDAAIGDVITSLIATEAIVNPVDYFNVVQRNADDVKAHPEKYLPWNYQAIA